MSALSGGDEDYQFHQRSGVIRKILEHLNLWRIQKQPRTRPENKFTSSQHNPCPPVTEQEDFFDDGWPGYEESVFSAD